MSRTSSTCTTDARLLPLLSSPQGNSRAAAWPGESLSNRRKSSLAVMHTRLAGRSVSWLSDVLRPWLLPNQAGALSSSFSENQRRLCRETDRIRISTETTARRSASSRLVCLWRTRRVQFKIDEVSELDAKDGLDFLNPISPDVSPCSPYVGHLVFLPRPPL